MAANEIIAAKDLLDRLVELLFYNSLYQDGGCNRRRVSTRMVPVQRLEPLSDHVVNKKGAKKDYFHAANYNYGRITGNWMQKLIHGSFAILPNW